MASASQQPTQIQEDVDSRSLESLAKTVIGLGAIAYVAGVITINAYLAYLGLSDFSPVKGKALVTGVLVFGSMLLIATLPDRVYGSWNEAIFKKQLVSTRQKFKYVLQALLPFVILSLICFYLESHSLWTRSWSAIVWRTAFNSTALYAAAVGSLILALKAITKYRSSLRKTSLIGMSNSWSRFIACLMGAGLCLMLYSAVFSTAVYPRISEQLGGGKVTSHRLLISHELVPVLAKQGLKFDGDLTQPVFVINVNDDMVALAFEIPFIEDKDVSISSLRVLQINRESVNGILDDYLKNSPPEPFSE